ncbi:uncharacterized protein METZ01_LOCUS223226, partial [marine metagenome]
QLNGHCAQNVTETSPTCVRHREYLIDHYAYNDLSS